MRTDAPLSAVSTRKGRIAVRLDSTFKDDKVVGVQATDGSENVCLATRSARVLIFPVTEANIVSGAARGVVAIRLEPKDRVLYRWIGDNLKRARLDRVIARLPAWQPRTATLPLGARVSSVSGRLQFYTVRVENGVAMPAFKASGDITSMSRADGYIEIPEHTDFVEKGTLVEVKLF